MAQADSEYSAICNICNFRFALYSKSKTLWQHGGHKLKCPGECTTNYRKIKKAVSFKERRHWRKINTNYRFITEKELLEHEKINDMDKHSAFSIWRKQWKYMRVK